MDTTGKGHVYVIGSPHLSRVVRVGVSCNVQRRLRTLRAGSPLPLAIQWQSEALADYSVEGSLHRVLGFARLHGEWFQLERPVEQVKRALAELDQGIASPDKAERHSAELHVSELLRLESLRLRTVAEEREQRRKMKEKDESDHQNARPPNIFIAVREPCQECHAVWVDPSWPGNHFPHCSLALACRTP